MEALLSPGSVKQSSAKKSSISSFHKDLWLICKEGSIADLDSALQLLKKNGGNIDARNVFGLTPLHIATWRNHVPIVKRLLTAGADPDARDGESGWSSLHRALHFGHLAIASALLQAGASLTLEDSKSRTPVDLLSGPVYQVVGHELKSVATEVYSWGSGTNYQLGTGNAHIQKLPCKVDAFHGLYITKIAASKFHSVAVSSDGKLYTWGFGRGGRLGHPDFDVHSGQAAVITPRLVTTGLGSRRVRVVAAAKHHTVVATDNGEVFTWGSNREGQLGYTSVDTQATPRRVSSLRAKIVSVAAANKHSVAVAESGEVYTWGCNKEGQLGYGTSNSASNSIPRMVEYLKGKGFRSVSAAKYHTVVLGADGEVFTWGHRLVTPRRVLIARNIKKNGFAPLKFHRMERLHVISVAAGLTHTTALTDDGALFYWASADPELRCQQLYSMCERTIVSISAGKYWTSFVTNTGDVYTWDGKKSQVDPPNLTRLRGFKRATSVCVGETHLLVLSALYHPTYPPQLVASTVKSVSEDDDKTEEFNEDIQFIEMEANISYRNLENEDTNKRTIPSLKSLCEKVAAEFLVEPRNVVQLMEIADSLGADELRNYCEEIAVRNLDYIFTISAPTIASVSPEVLVKLEKSLDTRSSENWSHRHLPTPTATFPAVVYSDEEDSGQGSLRIRENNEIIPKIYGGSGVDSFLQSDTDHALSKQVRALRKKLQQIEMLEAKQLNGHQLDDQQFAKLQTKSSVESALSELGFPVVKESKLSSLSSDAKGCKKSGTSRKQRKAKQKTAQAEALSANSEITEEPVSIKGFPDINLLGASNNKEIVCFDVDDESNNANFPCFNSPKVASVSQSTAMKKKNRKGGLSMFLSGALDDASKLAPPPATPISTGPAWGGAKFTKGDTSLRDIQNEQNKLKEVVPIKSKNRSEESSGTVNNGHVMLSSFLPGAISNPILLIPTHASEGDKNTPSWSSGTSPGLGRLSLRDIQKQQERKQLGISHSPKTKTSGFSVSPSEAGGMKDSVPNRWFKPEIDAPSSIRFIQIEERAIKDLKRFYSSVKLVKPQQQSS